jgi:hypothetical protein
MPPPMIPTPLDNAPVFDLCNAREKRFLLDLIQQEEPGVFAQPPPCTCTMVASLLERGNRGTSH